MRPLPSGAARVAQGAAVVHQLGADGAAQLGADGAAQLGGDGVGDRRGDDVSLGRASAVVVRGVAGQPG